MQQNVTVKIPKEQHEALKTLARIRGVFISKLIRTAINRYLNDQKQGVSA